jgi:hypothetical protein
VGNLNELLENNSLLKPKTLCYIALCNYKIGNIETSYLIANKAKRIIPNILKNSLIQGVSGEMIGLEKINELIDTLEDKFHKTVSVLNPLDDSFDENQMNLKKVEKYLSTSNSGLTQVELKSIIELFKRVQQQIAEFGDSNNASERASQLIHLLEVFKTPLLFAWEKLKYGHHSDFWEEGDSMFNYISFATQPQVAIEPIIKAWDSEPPTGFFGNNAEKVSKSVRHIYDMIQNEEM